MHDGSVRHVSPVDLAIRNVRIIDGTGAPAFDADVEIDGGRITTVGTASGTAKREIDGRGQVLSPGFVDTHTHDDAALVLHPGLEFKVAQGCTSLVIGNCGSSAFPPGAGLAAVPNADWTDLDGFRATVHGKNIAANAIALIGHNTVRSSVMGPTEKRPPTGAELDAMQAMVSRAMEQGACGFSTGLIYTPGRWAHTDEVVALAKAAGAKGGVYATHMRNEGDKLLEAVDEALLIARESGCPLHISHHKAVGRNNWGRVVDSLAKVDDANASGADVTLDVYPYTAGSGPMVQYVDLDNISIAWAQSTRLAACPPFPEYEGRMLTEIAAADGIALDDLVRKILTTPKGDRTISVTFGMDEGDLETNLRHPLMMVGSDGIPDLRGKPHPRLFGTFPRVLGEYVRTRGIVSLEEAVRRMTSLSCDRFGLTGRGRIAEGQLADVVLFDPDTIVDTATYDDPKQEPVGVSCVIVNGEIAYENGHHTGVGSGRLLHYRSET